MDYHSVLSQPGFLNMAEQGAFPTWLLILFLFLGVLLIFLIIAVIVYFVLRAFGKNEDDPEDAETLSIQDVPAMDNTSATHLPVGTELKDGLYRVNEVLVTTENLNVYIVEQTQPLYLCPHCHTELGEDTSAFCRSCGAALDVIPPTYPTYLMSESDTSGAFEVAERLIGMNLQHAALILPVDTFTDKALGLPRWYMIEPGNQEPRLSQAIKPLPLNVVLDMGVDLAEGLAYLHKYNVILTNPSPAIVAYTEKEARWICYGNITLSLGEEMQDGAQLLSANVKALAVMLQALLLKEDSQTLAISLPEAVTEVFQHYINSVEQVTAENMVRSLRHVVRMLGGQNEVRYRIGALSDVGRLRDVNEDSMLSHDLSSDFETSGATVLIAGVADGVGGHAAGEVASQLAVSTLEKHIKALQENAQIGRTPTAREWLGNAASEANEMVYKGRTDAGNNMACTLVLALFTGDMATILNVGDSRGYLMNERGIRQITTDHSLVERLVAIGEITREQARHHPRKSVIYRVIGDRLKLDYDLFEQTFVPGEALLMCSDGLTDMVEDATIWRIWRASQSPQEAVEKLVAEANNAGGIDNITVVIVEIAV